MPSLDRDRVDAGNRDWLAAMRAGPALIDELVEICHGSPFDEDAYIFDDLDARRGVAASQRPLCLYGHTHVPPCSNSTGS